MEVISKGKMSPQARDIAAVGRKTARNLLVLEAVEGYASLLQNVLNLPSEVAPPKAVSDIPINLKEQWQWKMFEAVSNWTYLNRTSRSFLDKYEEQWNHAPENESDTTDSASDSFSYSIWEEEEHTHMANTRRRIEEEEVRPVNILVHGIS